MVRSRLVLTWCLRMMWREDAACRRFDSLKGSRDDQVKSGIPVFVRQKTGLT